MNYDLERFYELSRGKKFRTDIVHAQAGISRADFINHLRIARKEAKETNVFWLQASKVLSIKIKIKFEVRNS